MAKSFIEEILLHLKKVFKVKTRRRRNLKNSSRQKSLRKPKAKKKAEKKKTKKKVNTGFKTGVNRKIIKKVKKKAARKRNSTVKKKGVSGRTKKISRKKSVVRPSAVRSSTVRPSAKPRKSLGKKVLPKKKEKAAKAPKSQDLSEKKIVEVGEISHYFSRIGVIVIKIAHGKISVGEKVVVKGKSTNFVQVIKSMQIESRDVPSAKKGQIIGLKVEKQARAGDRLYKFYS